MTAAFSNEELDKLAGEFRFATAPSADRSMSIRAADLLDPDLCIAYLDRVNAVFEATTRTACASLFAKRYSCLAMASSLYAMSVLNKCFDYGLDNCHVESHYQGSPWLPRVRLDDRSLTQPGPLGREAWRESVLRRVFADNLSRVWGSLSKAGPVSKAVLWENTAIYVHWLYEDRFVEGAGEEEAARLREDYRYLMSGAPGELFGERVNPLSRFDAPKVATKGSGTPIRIRKTCCFYYQASDEPDDYCPTCPKLKHEKVAETSV